MARPEGLEPPAYWFEANRSIQLSYGRGSNAHRSILPWGSLVSCGRLSIGLPRTTAEAANRRAGCQPAPHSCEFSEILVIIIRRERKACNKEAPSTSAEAGRSQRGASNGR